MPMVRIDSKEYQFLVMQRALTGVSAKGQVEKLVQAEMERTENAKEKETPLLSPIRQ